MGAQPPLPYSRGSALSSNVAPQPGMKNSLCGGDELNENCSFLGHSNPRSEQWISHVGDLILLNFIS